MSFFYTLITDHLITHWGLCSILGIFDWITGTKYKLPNREETESEKGEKGDTYDTHVSYKNTVSLVVFNQLASIPLIYCLPEPKYDVSTWFLSGLYKFFIALLLEEIFFYYGHRLFHLPILYSRFHKIHHRWKKPIALSAFYAHPAEHLLVNIAPVLVSGYLAGLGKVEMRLWLCVATINALLFAHGGYKLPLYKNRHDIHHREFNRNYGVLGILDYIHGTN